MPTLYVMEPGAQVEKEYHRILVTKEDEVLFRTPIQHISSLVLVGTVGLTTPAMYALLDNKIPVTLVRRSGDLIGQLIPSISPNLELRRSQLQFDKNENAKFLIAKEIVKAKIHNQRILALRIIRRHPAIEAALEDKIRELEKSVADVNDLDELRGVEGVAARFYFDIYEQAFDPTWNFHNRNRRPPRDPINALLSLGYTLLGNSLISTLQITGLDPYLGVFHEEQYGRPALALDLLEEFRSPLIDSLVMTIINKKLINDKNFIYAQANEEEALPVELDDKALRLFFREFSEKIDSTVMMNEAGRPIRYRKIFEIQARKLAKVISGREEKYCPFYAR